MSAHAHGRAMICSGGAPKASDTFGPIGPVIATDVDYTDAQLETRINGEVVQKQTTADLIFPVTTIVSFISQAITLETGRCNLYG